jgi:hypothetical protein
MRGTFPAPVMVARPHRNRTEPAQAGTHAHDHDSYPSSARDRPTWAILAILHLTAGRHTP